MIKLMLVLYRRPDLDVAAFRRYLHQTHLPLVARLPGLRRAVVNLAPLDGAFGTAGDEAPPAGAPACDGIGEDWFDSAAALQAALASPEGQAAAVDGPNFLDMSRTQMLMVEEQELPLPAAVAEGQMVGTLPAPE